MKNMQHMIRTLGAAALIAFAGQTLAAPMTLNGDNVDFTFDDAALGLFGTPTVDGDSLVFSPLAFEAPFGPVPIANSTILITVELHSDVSLLGAGVTESGTYFHSGNNIGLFNAQGELRVTDITPSNPGVLEEDFDLVLFAPGDNPVDDVVTPWNMNISADLSGAAWDGATLLTMQIQNVLTGFAQFEGDQTFIGKDSVRLTVDTEPNDPQPIPAPGVLSLLGIGLLALRRLSRR